MIKCWWSFTSCVQLRPRPEVLAQFTFFNALRCGPGRRRPTCQSPPTAQPRRTEEAHGGAASIFPGSGALSKRLPHGHAVRRRNTHNGHRKFTPILNVLICQRGSFVNTTSCLGSKAVTSPTLPGDSSLWRTSSPGKSPQGKARGHQCHSTSLTTSPRMLKTWKQLQVLQEENG